MEMENKIVCCNCGILDCYVEVENDVSSYLCLSCGYTTNSLLVPSSEAVIELEKGSPRLIVASKFEDSNNNLNWYPSVLNFPSKGMIFPDGTRASNWKWCVVKTIQIPEDEKENYPIPGKPGEFYSSKLDMENKKMYDKTDFRSACIELGVITTENN